jgi:FkbM family methyltransferase
MPDGPGWSVPAGALGGVIARLRPSTLRRRAFKLAQRKLRARGLALVTAPSRTEGPPVWDVWDWVAQSTRIRTLIDIGANDGGYTEYLNGFFKPAAVHAFEPLAASQPSLTALDARLPHLTVHPVALADEPGEARFFQNAYAPASSLLPVSEHSRRIFPETAAQSEVTVPVARLDDILSVGSLEPDILVKIDVQGAEDRVIRGGRAVFSAAAIVLIEMSFVPFYEGQPLFEDVHSLLVACGLRLAGFKNQIDDPASGRPLFAHCLYHRPGSLRPS